MRPEKEVQSQSDLASAAYWKPSTLPSMSYEQGVSDALRWVLGETDDLPIEAPEEDKEEDP